MEELAARPSAIEEARRILFPLMHRTGMPEIARAARAARDKIEARAKELRGRAEGRAREARVAEAERFVRLEQLFQHGYRFGEARRFARRAQAMLVKQGMAARAEELGGRVEAITRAEILFETFLRRVDEGKLRDQKVAVPGGVVGRLVGVRRDAAALVVATRTGGERRVRWERFPPAEMLKLFRAMRPSPGERLSVAEFCLEHGMVHAARSQLRFASRVMPEHRPLADRLKARARNASGSKPPEEDDAATLVELALEEAAAGHLDEARSALDLLRTRYAATTAAREKLAEVKAAVDAAAGR